MGAAFRSAQRFERRRILHRAARSRSRIAGYPAAPLSAPAPRAARNRDHDKPKGKLPARYSRTRAGRRRSVLGAKSASGKHRYPAPDHLAKAGKGSGHRTRRKYPSQSLRGGGYGARRAGQTAEVAGATWQRVESFHVEGTKSPNDADDFDVFHYLRLFSCSPRFEVRSSSPTVAWLRRACGDPARNRSIVASAAAIAAAMRQAVTFALPFPSVANPAAAKNRTTA